MPDILVITTSERVKGVFHSLEKTGGVRVRTAASIPLAELGISFSTPDCTFIHGGVSGYPVNLLIQHMKTVLPEDANLAVLAEDHVEKAQAVNDGVTVFDLRMDEKVLRTAIANVLDDLPNSLTGKVIEVPVIPEPGSQDRYAEPAIDEEPFALEKESAAYAALGARIYGKDAAERAEEVAEFQSPRREHPTVRELLEQAEWSEQINEECGRLPWRSKARVVAYAAAALGMALAAFSICEKQTVPPRITHARGPANVSVRPVTAKPPATLGPTVQKPLPKKGVPSLPPMLANSRLDQDFGRSHLGWERYLGADYEYRLFKEGGLYRAMQVFPRKNQPVPEQFLKKALLQFGGDDRYRVESVEKKGRLTIARGESKDGVAVSVYERQPDGQAEAFVLYYR